MHARVLGCSHMEDAECGRKAAVGAWGARKVRVLSHPLPSQDPSELSEVWRADDTTEEADNTSEEASSPPFMHGSLQRGRTVWLNCTVWGASVYLFIYLRTDIIRWALQ